MNKNFRKNRNFVGKHVKVFAQAENVLGNALKSSNELKVRWAWRKRFRTRGKRVGRCVKFYARAENAMGVEMKFLLMQKAIKIVTIN